MSLRPISVTLGALGGDPRDSMVRLARLGGAGIGSVQLSATQLGMRPRELDRSARRGLRERLTQLELRISGIDLWIPPGHLTDRRQVDRAADSIREAIEFAAEFGRVGVSLSLPTESPSQSSRKTPGGPADDDRRDAGRLNATSPLDRPAIVTAEAFAAFVAGGGHERDSETDTDAQRRAECLNDVLTAMLDDADRHGVDLIDHAVPPRGTEHAGAAHHRLRVGIDPAAWLAVGAEPAVAAARHATRIALVRLCDLTVGGLRAPISDEFAPVGHAERQLDVIALAGAVSVIGSGVPLVADTRQWPDPWAGLEQTLDVWNRARR